MRIFFLLATLIFVTACSADEQNDNSSTESQSQSSGWFKDKRVKQYLAMMEQSLNTSTLFYSRISPEVAKHIKPITVPPEATKVVECVVDKVKDNNIEDAFDESMKVSREFSDYIENTPELTLLTLEKDAKFNAMQETMMLPKFEQLTQISKDCGLIKLNMKLTTSSGVMEAVQQMHADHADME
jgi:hypothetical protein